MPSFLSKRPSGPQLLIICVLLLLPAACSTGLIAPKAPGTAEDFRQSAYRSIHGKRYAEGMEALGKALKLEPNGSGYLLLGDLQEALEQFRAAQNSYRKGLGYSSDEKLRQSFYFHLAVLAILEFKQLDRADELAEQLPETTAAALNLAALQALQQNHYDEAIRLTEQVLSNPQQQEMTGWAYYCAARAWLAVNNDAKASEALFFAINHARGHGLVARITKLWEELRQRPLSR